MVRENFNKELLVEGTDDRHVVYSLREKYNITPDFGVSDCRGVNELFDAFQVKIKKPNQIIGIIIDADDDISGRWQRISGILLQGGIEVPDNIHVDGVILEKPEMNLKIGIWIMPNNNLNGMLEDFMRFLIPDDDQLLPIAEESLLQIESQNIQKYRPVQRSKALMHTWLAWQETPGRPFGQSITMKYLDADADVCQRFVSWIRNTFSD